MHHSGSPDREEQDGRGNDRSTSGQKKHTTGSREDEFGGDSQFKSKLLNSKANAKDAEKAALTLRNRIAVLEKEEQTVLKKIEGAKKQALEILEKRSKRQMHHEEKEKVNTEKNREIEVKRTQITNKKDEMCEKLKGAISETINNHKEKANEIKESMKVRQL